MKNIFLTIFVILSIFFFANSAISLIITEKDKKGLTVTTRQVRIETKKEEIKPKIDPILELGKKLFFDPLLSKDGTVSCASCHKPEHGFADDKPTS